MITSDDYIFLTGYKYVSRTPAFYLESSKLVIVGLTKLILSTCFTKIFYFQRGYQEFSCVHCGDTCQCTLNPTHLAHQWHVIWSTPYSPFCFNPLSVFSFSGN